MRRPHRLILVLVTAVVPPFASAGTGADDEGQTWLRLAGSGGASATIAPTVGSWLAAAAKEEAQGQSETKITREQQIERGREKIPGPKHTVEGVGGGSFVPTAYLVNPGPEGTLIAMPSVSFTYAHLGYQKSIQAFAVTQTFLRRIELGYALLRLDLGSFPNAVSNLTQGWARIGTDDIYLHNFNIRGLLLEENCCALPLPALTAGIHFKYNSSISDINHRLRGGLRFRGYRKSKGVDFTLTASKTIWIDPAPPVMVTLGLRNSKAAHIGLMGFGADCHTTMEFSVGTMLTRWLGVSYEFRRKINTMRATSQILGSEDNWHALRFSVVLSDHLSVHGGVALLGSTGNTNSDGAWGLQIKYDF